MIKKNNFLYYLHINLHYILEAHMVQPPNSPKGIIEIYFPLNLLDSVISCLRVQPF